MRLFLALRVVDVLQMGSQLQVCPPELMQEVTQLLTPSWMDQKGNFRQPPDSQSEQASMLSRCHNIFLEGKVMSNLVWATFRLDERHQSCRKKMAKTWIGEAAIKIPATPPPKTRPSLPARETLKLPVRCWSPSLPLLGRYEPDRESISYRPWKGEYHISESKQSDHLQSLLKEYE